MGKGKKAQNQSSPHVVGFEKIIVLTIMLSMRQKWQSSAFRQHLASSHLSVSFQPSKVREDCLITEEDAKDFESLAIDPMMVRRWVPKSQLSGGHCDMFRATFSPQESICGLQCNSFRRLEGSVSIASDGAKVLINTLF